MANDTFFGKVIWLMGTHLGFTHLRL